MQIFSGSTNQPLAHKIAKHLETDLGSVELAQFPNGEVRVWVTAEQVHKEVVVVQSFVGDPNKAILEFCLLVDALRRSGAKEITAVIPWMGYCIQDKVFRQGEPLSARVVATIIEAMNVDKVITVDLHNETIQGFFTCPVVHLSAIPLFLDKFREKDSGIEMVVAPDVGALKETTEIAHALDLPVAVLNKKRDRASGKVEIVGVEGAVEGKTILIMDDFISTGSTLIQTAMFLKKQGVQKIVVGVTHHLYVPGVQERLEASDIDEVFVTDTIKVEEDFFKHKLKILSVSALISAAF